MSVTELLVASYTWLEFYSAEIFYAAVIIPVAGTLMAWIGKGGRTDKDGRAVASMLVGFGLVIFLLEILALIIAHVLMEHDILDANILLLISPVVCLAGCLLGVRMVFPLSELASVRTFSDIGVFVAACLFVLWLFSKFRGWGIIFFGGLEQLLIIGVLGFFLLRTLYKRAFGGR